MNVPNLDLINGNRYYICVYAEETDLEFERFTQRLDSVSACSNGIVVDHDPPIAGDVWVGNSKEHRYYQVTIVEMW